MGSETKSQEYLRFSHVPQSYKISPSNRPSLNPEIASVPVIDLAGLDHPDRRSTIVKSIGNACRETGLFQIMNHGIEQEVLDGALRAAFGFFKLPMEEKARFMSSDVHKPVRYGTSLKDGVDKFQSWRVFLKHYAHPLKDWVDQWPHNPPDYRVKMGEYSIKVRNVALRLMEAITESLELCPNYLGNKMEDGMQVMAINCYPPCPEPHLALGLPPHSDYSCITIVLCSSCGLEIMDMSSSSNGVWRLVPEIHGALQVLIGDHMEVLSNGLYKSVKHRVTLNSETTRVSVASFHSLGMDEKMATAEALVDKEHPKRYRESSFKDFLDFFSKNDMSEGKSFIQSLKIN